MAAALNGKTSGKRARDEAPRGVKTPQAAFPELPTPQFGTVMTMEEVASSTLAADSKGVLTSRSTLKWIRRMRRLYNTDASSAPDCYYLSELTLHRKDLEDGSFSIKEVDYYRGFVVRAMACSKVAVRYLLNKRSDQLRALSRGAASVSAAQQANFAEPDEDDVKRLKTFLLEFDLTEQRSRMLDWKCQELFRMILAHVSLQMRSRRAAELAAASSGKFSEIQDAQLYALDIAERGMMQALAWIHELRAHYVFCDEKLAIGACALNGSRPILLRNRAYVSEEDLAELRSAGKPPGNPIGDFGDRHGPFLNADGVIVPPAPGSNAGVVPQNSHSSRDTKTASSQLSKFLNQGINACVRWDSVEGKYVVFYESHTIAEERDVQLRRSAGFRAGPSSGTDATDVVSYAHMSAIADTEARRQGLSIVAPALIKGVPTTFYLVAERSALMACMDKIIALIEIAARTTVGFQRLSFPNLNSSDFVYFGKAYGSLTASDFCMYRMPTPASKASGEFVLAVLPCLVLKSLQAVRLLAFGLYVNLLPTMPTHAEWMYPTGARAKLALDGTAFAKVYTDGYNFCDWEESMRSMTFEFHPGYTFFRVEAKRVIDTHRLTTSRRVMHEFDGTLECTRKLCLRALYRFSEDNPGVPMPEYTLLAPLEDFDHSAVIPKTGPIKEEPVYGSGPAGCTFTACKTLTNECRRGACLICAKDLDVARIKDHSSRRSFLMLSYKDVPMWQYSLSLRNVRNLLLKLDEDARIRGTGFATVEDLEVWIKREANLGPIWNKLKGEFLNHIKDLEGFHSQMVANYTKMHAHHSTRPAGISGSGVVDSRLIKRIMADHAEDFCTDEFGTPMRQGSTIRFGDSHALVVFVGDENAGSYTNWKPPCDKGNIFDLVINHVFKSGASASVREQHDRAAEYCYGWLVKRFGSKYIEQWSDKDSKVAASAASSSSSSFVNGTAKSSVAAKKIEDQNATSMQEARRIWMVSKRITKEFYEAGFCATPVNYLRGRGITAPELVFGNKVIRYNPACSVSTGPDTNYQNPALIFAVTNPTDTSEAPEVTGVQCVYLDPSTNRKAEDLLDVQKKSRGIVKGNACRLRKRPDDPETISATLEEYKALIAVGEGPETMLSVAQACPNLEVYCTLSIGNIANFPYIGHVKWGAGILYCADNDVKDTQAKQDHNEKARSDNINKLRAKGYTVLLCLPALINGKSTDFNDVLTSCDDPEIAAIKIKRALHMAQTFLPTSPDPDAVKVVELADDGQHLKELPKRVLEEKDPKKRKALLMEAMRKRKSETEDKKVEEKPDKKEKEKEKGDNDSVSGISDSSLSEAEEKKTEQARPKKKKLKSKPRQKKSPPPSSSSSSPSSSSSSSSSSSESEPENKVKAKKKKSKSPEPSSSSSSSSSSEESEPEKTATKEPEAKKSRLKKMTAAASSTSDVLIATTDSAQGSASSPSTPLINVGEEAMAETQKEGVGRRPRVIEEDP